MGFGDFLNSVFGTEEKKKGKPKGASAADWKGKWAADRKKK
ncbi:MAG: hypothetical protein V1676_03875 [Candidatus Diapherotrites archaeon]